MNLGLKNLIVEYFNEKPTDSLTENLELAQSYLDKFLSEGFILKKKIKSFGFKRRFYGSVPLENRYSIEYTITRKNTNRKKEYIQYVMASTSNKASATWCIVIKMEEWKKRIEKAEELLNE